MKILAITEKECIFADDMQWTDRIRQVKIVLVVTAIVIAVASLAVSHLLVKDLQREERNKMEVWAQAMQTLQEADETTDLALVLSVIQGNKTIPVIVLDSDEQVMDYRNVDNQMFSQYYGGLSHIL